MNSAGMPARNPPSGGSSCQKSPAIITLRPPKATSNKGGDNNSININITAAGAVDRELLYIE